MREVDSLVLVKEGRYVPPVKSSISVASTGFDWFTPSESLIFPAAHHAPLPLYPRLPVARHVLDELPLVLEQIAVGAPVEREAHGELGKRDADKARG